MEEIINNEMPVGEQIILPKKPKINIWMISTLLLLMVLIFCGLYMYSLSKKVIEPPVPAQTPVAIVSPVIKNKISIADAISQYCIDGKINIDKLPFNLDESFVEEHRIEDNTLVCNKRYYGEDGTDCGMDTTTCNAQIKTQRMDHYNGRDDVVIQFSYLTFISNKSIDTGYPDSFISLNKYCLPIQINDHNYWLKIEAPGPYGVSSEGISVSFIAEKTDFPSGTVARSSQYIYITNKQIIDSLKKYGCKLDGYPEYTFGKENCPSGDWSSFQKELINLLQNHSMFNSIADYANHYLGGVSF